MANRLKVAVVHAVIGLLPQGWSYQRIARELGVYREIVARYVQLRQAAGSKPAKATPGCLGLELPDRCLGLPSHCQPLATAIKEKLDQGLSGQRIWQDLVTEHGFDGSYSSVKRFVRRLGAGTSLPFRRMECESGYEAQVDFGSGIWIVESYKKQRAYVLRIVLSHSRKGYSEAVLKQNTENFILVL